MLTKTQSVLYWQASDANGDFLIFAHTEEPHDKVVQLHPETWVEMGRPDVITVSIQPGDLLNEEVPA